MVDNIVLAPKETSSLESVTGNKISLRYALKPPINTVKDEEVENSEFLYDCIDQNTLLSVKNSSARKESIQPTEEKSNGKVVWPCMIELREKVFVCSGGTHTIYLSLEFLAHS